MAIPSGIVPPSRPGYHAAYLFRYPTLGLNLAAALVGLGALIGFAYLGWIFHGRPENSSIQLDGWSLLVIFIVPFITLVVHEWLHGLAFRILGYKVSYGFYWKLLAAFAAAFRQYIPKPHFQIVTAMPTLVLTPLGLILLAMPIPALFISGYLILVINTSGLVGDAFAFLHAARHASTTLYYDEDVEHMYVLEPVSEQTQQEV